MAKVCNSAKGAKNLPPKVQRAIQVVFTPVKRVASSIADLGSEGDTTGYILERRLEAITCALERDRFCKHRNQEETRRCGRTPRLAECRPHPTRRPAAQR